MSHRNLPCLAVLSALLLAGCNTLPPPRPQTLPAASPAPQTEVDVTASDDSQPLPAPLAPTPAEVEVEPARSPSQRFRDSLQPGCAEVAEADAAPFVRRHLRTVLQRQAALFNYVVDAVLQHDLPGEFAAIPIIESGYRPDPGNRGDVRGLWQFSAGTARHFGLRTGLPGDDRLSPVRSTAAALKHLGQMWQQWNDWRLAVIGYNAGEYAVSQALKRHPAVKDWRRLGLPRRSQAYVQRLRAISCVIADDTQIAEALDAAAPLAVADALPQRHSATTVAAVLQMNRDALLQLNPLLRFADSRNAGPLLLPVSALEHIAALPKADTATDTRATASEHTLVYRVRAGDSLWRIARRHGLRVADLLRWNELQPNQTLRIGQQLRLAP